jgi:DNA uptake protein ComE-like DNA-binding protein
VKKQVDSEFRLRELGPRDGGTKTNSSARWGSVLLLVVVVIAMLTLATFNFAQTMTTEMEAASMYTLDAQSRITADSGVEFVAALLGDRKTMVAENLIHNPSLFMGRVVSASPHLRANSRFTIIAPVEHDSKNGAIRYGLMDESAKLNLNYLPNMGLSDADLTTLLLNIPQMTNEMIDSILDWMDSDDTKRPYGAESEDYQQMNPPYKAKNGPFETIDELLLVKGITPTLLYGEDANRNGLLDPNENDGDKSPPLDNADGVLDHGFVAYFSVHGRESNRKKDGKLKIWLNDGFLTDLYDALEQEFDTDTAKYIIGYRINGPSTAPAKSKTNPVVASTKLTANSGSTTTATAPKSIQDQEAASSITDFLAFITKSGGNVTRGGIDLSKGASASKGNIESLWELIDAGTKVTINGKQTNLPAIWKSDSGSITTLMPELLEKLTTTKDEYLEGRININQARREILMGIPTMTEEIANAIVAAQRLDSNGQPSLDTIRQHTNTAWLNAEGLVDAAGMVNLDPYITSHGDVYRVQVLGFFDGGGPVSRIEAMIDSTQLPPRVIAQRDLNELGRGYSRAQLLQIAK